jgi:hypothetical protein
MPDNARDMLFEMNKQQDLVMHNLSSELAVKTSLYLVFTAFTMSAAIQIMGFCKDIKSCSARYAVLFSALGAALALLAGASFLVAALVRDYSMFPGKAMADFIQTSEMWNNGHPDDLVNVPNGFMDTLIRTVDDNQIVNQKKTVWLKVGAWMLMTSLPFTALGGIFAVVAYLTRSS